MKGVSQILWVVILLVIGLIIVVGFAKAQSRATNQANETTGNVIENQRLGFTQCLAYCAEACGIDTDTCEGIVCENKNYQPVDEADKECGRVLEKSREP